MSSAQQSDTDADIIHDPDHHATMMMIMMVRDLKSVFGPIRLRQVHAHHLDLSEKLCHTIAIWLME